MGQRNDESITKPDRQPRFRIMYEYVKKEYEVESGCRITKKFEKYLFMHVNFDVKKESLLLECIQFFYKRMDIKFFELKVSSNDMIFARHFMNYLWRKVKEERKNQEKSKGYGHSFENIITKAMFGSNRFL